VPQQQKPPKIFYGWWVVFACFMCALTSGIVGYGFTAFFNPIVQEFGWSYAAISLAASLRGAETGILSPVLGFLIDRWSAKWILFTGVLTLVAGLVFFSRVSTLSQFYGAWLVIAIGTSCCSSSVVNPAINPWFRRNMGKAMGILNTGYALSGLFIPVIYYLIASYNWRTALVIIGIGFLVICVPLTLIIKDRPERYGYWPDGATQPSNSSKPKTRNPEAALIQTEVNISTGRALKSRTFWYLTVALTLQGVVYIAAVNHIMPYLKTVHIDGSTASFFAGAIPVLSIFGRLGGGWLSDKYNGKRVAVASFVLICLGTLLFDYVTDSNLWLLVVTIIIFSVGMGSSVILRPVLTLEYFGRSRFASIFGILIGITSIGAMLGPYLAGWTFDIWHSYHYAWIIFTGLSVVSLTLMATMPRVQMAQNIRA
jgi:sugar phosphate permease